MVSYRKVVLVLIVLVLAVGGLAAVELSRISKNIYVQITESASRGLRDRLTLFLAPPLDGLNLARSFLTQDDLETKPSAAVISLLFPVLTEQPAVVAVIVSDRKGPSELLIREGEGFLGAQAQPDHTLRWRRYQTSREPAAQTPVDLTLSKAALEALAESRVQPAPDKPAWSRAFFCRGSGGRCLRLRFRPGRTTGWCSLLSSASKTFTGCAPRSWLRKTSRWYF